MRTVTAVALAGSAMGLATARRNAGVTLLIAAE
jgi:hypothetical protein